MGNGSIHADPELGCICSQRFRRRQRLRKTDGGRVKADAAWVRRVGWGGGGPCCALCVADARLSYSSPDLIRKTYVHNYGTYIFIDTNVCV